MKITDRYSVDARLMTKVKKLTAGEGRWEDMGFANSWFLYLDREAQSAARVKGFFDKRDTLILHTTEFSKSDLESANCLSARSESFGSFVASERLQDYLPKCYDVSRYCAKCGSGAIQTGSHTLKGVPKMARNTTFQCHWFFDCLFVRRDAFEAVFAPFGIGFWPVLSAGGREVDHIVQLKFERYVHIDLASAQELIACQACGQQKDRYDRIGFWPCPLEPVETVALSIEQFGDGASADRDMLFSPAVYRAMADHGLNVHFRACADMRLLDDRGAPPVSKLRTRWPWARR